MKLYTEEQVRHAFRNGFIYANLNEVNENQTINSFTPIELPSDEEIRKWAEMQSLGEPTGAEEFGRIYGAKFVIDKIQGSNK